MSAAIRLVLVLACPLLGLAVGACSRTRTQDTSAAEASGAEPRQAESAGTTARPPSLPPSETLPPVALPGSPESESPSSAEVRAAMLSVYYYADRKADVELRSRFLANTEAARILIADARSSSFGESRRRRAVVRLIVGGLELDDDGRHSHRYRDALLILLAEPEPGRPGAEVLEEIDAEIEEVIAAFSPPTAVSTAIPIELLRQIGERVFALLNSGGAAVRGCDVVTEAVPGQSDPSQATSTCGHPDESWKTSLIWVETTVSVKRDFSEVVEALDPQNWDAYDAIESKRCSPWFQTEIVEPPNWDKVGCPPTPGADWNELLWEQFSVPYVLGVTRFDNVLGVESKREVATGPNRRHRFDFCLNQYLGGNVGDDESGSIVVDEGSSEVREGVPEWVDLTAEKKLSFVGWTDNAFLDAVTEYALQNMGDAHAEQACCRTPTPPACVTP